MKTIHIQDKILVAITENTNYPLFEIGMAFKQLRSFDRLLSAINRATEQKRSLSEVVDILAG